MLRTCLAAAEVDGSVCVFLEPIALYHTRDLHSEGDNGWLARYAPPDDWAREHTTVGRARVYGDGEHLTIVTFGNGVRMSLRVAARQAELGIGVRVVDLRWLLRCPWRTWSARPSATGRVLVVDETRRSGASERAFWPRWWTPDTSGRPAGYRPRIRTFRSGTPRNSCWCPKR